MAEKNRIREWRQYRGMTQSALAAIVGTSTPQIHRLEVGQRRLTQHWLTSLAQALHCQPADLLPETGYDTQQRPFPRASDSSQPGYADPVFPKARPHHNPGVMDSQAARRGSVPPGYRRTMYRDLPVFGTARAGHPESLIIPEELSAPVDWIDRPPQLNGIEEAFAIYIVGESMQPRFEPGEIAWIHPHRPPGPGDDVLLIHKNNDALIKRLVRSGKDIVILQQFNPQKDFTVESTSIRSLLLVIGRTRS